MAAQDGTTNHAGAVDLVGTNRVRAFAGAGYVGFHDSDVTMIGEELAVDDLRIIFPRSSDLVGPFNEALSAMNSDGSLAAITDRYFSR